MVMTLECAEGESWEKTCMVSCRKFRERQGECPSKPDPEKVVVGFDGGRDDQELVLGSLKGDVWEFRDDRIWHMPSRTDLASFHAEQAKVVRELADLYVRPTFFNRPIGVDDSGTAVYWSDIVDENIAAADVTITL